MPLTNPFQQLNAEVSQKQQLRPCHLQSKQNATPCRTGRFPVMLSHDKTLRKQLSHNLPQFCQSLQNRLQLMWPEGPSTLMGKGNIMQTGVKGPICMQLIMSANKFKNKNIFIITWLPSLSWRLGLELIISLHFRRQKDPFFDITVLERACHCTPGIQDTSLQVYTVFSRPPPYKRQATGLTSVLFQQAGFLLYAFF